MSVVVAVRVRPFNSREIGLNSQLCIDMDGGTRTSLLDLNDPKKNKDFFFDYSFWSHDGFELNEDGLAVPVSDRYADQRAVYNQVGQQILDNAWLGYHCCLFAYGQTGAGKSYSMVGYGANKGIVPIACQEIFERIKLNDNPHLEQEVSCSMLEIYNETVQDLLIPVSKRPTGGLKIRQHQSLGFYVDGMSKHPVESYSDIEKIMDTGTQNRTVASTQMNACSSRAHTIIIIQFKQTEEKGDRKYEKLSIINLVDLAGSEKVAKTGATDKRLKEATNINLSLTTLGKVIQALADKEMGKNKNQVIPYRESCLTKILCNALGGNSKTLMICAVSPSNDNYEETLSTLRYADQAKKIKNKATVNESATDKLIRELTEENEKLKQFMQKFQDQFGINLNNLDMKNIENLDPQVYNIQEVKEKKEEFEANQHLLEDTTKTKQQRHIENKKLEEDQEQNKIDLSKPYLVNVHEDPQLHNKIQYSLDKEVVVIGSKHSQPKPDIIVGFTRNNVAKIIHSQDSKQLFIEQYSDQYDCNILVNGVPVKEKTELFHLDRIIISTTSMFTLIFKDQVRSDEKVTFEQIDYDFVQEEMNTYLEIENKTRIQEFEEKKHEKEVETQKQTFEQQKQWEDQKIQLENQIKELQEKNKKQENNKKFKDKNYLEHKLQKFLPKVLELNLIAKELKRNISLQAKICQLYSDEDEEEPNANTINNKSKIQIQVDNRELGQVFIWDQAKFNERYYQIKEQLEKYFETNQIPSLDNSEDPFYDPPEPHLIGNGYFKLLYLAYFMDSQIELSLVGENGQCGSLQVGVIPCDETGEKNLAKEMEEEEGSDVIEDPKQLLGKEMYVKITISSAVLPDNFCRDTFVEYNLMDQDGKMQTFRTETIVGKNSRPNYTFQRIHYYSSISEEHLDYFQNKNLIFKVLGLEEIKGEQNKMQAQIPVEEEIEYANIKNHQKKQNQQQQAQVQNTNSSQGSLSTISSVDQSRTNNQVVFQQSFDPTFEVQEKNKRSNTMAQPASQKVVQQNTSSRDDMTAQAASKGKGKKGTKEECNIF
ncbi:hypothetical protein ABPG74_016028 [Tetrahymena malaccensis]